MSEGFFCVFAVYMGVWLSVGCMCVRDACVSKDIMMCVCAYEGLCGCIYMCVRVFKESVSVWYRCLCGMCFSGCVCMNVCIYVGSW